MGAKVMHLQKATVESRFVGTGTAEDPHRPQFADDYPTVAWGQVDGASNGKQATCKLLIRCDEQMLQRIRDDVRYGQTVRRA